MSLRSFFLWFWGILFGSGIAGGATLAVLQASSVPPPAPVVQEVSATEPLPVPPVPSIAETAAPMVLPRAHPHMIATRPTHEARRFAELALPTRITVVPPIPPAHVMPSVASEATARVMRLPALRSPMRAEPRETITAPPELRPRAYAYARNYPRYSYYSYSYPYPYSYYPYPYYYSYSY